MQAPTPAANSAFRLTFEELLARAPAGTVRHHDFVRVPSNQKPWLDTGIDLAAGETVTTIGVGQTFLTGTPLVAGTFRVKFWALGDSGTQVSKTYRIKIQPAPRTVASRR